MNVYKSHSNAVAHLLKNFTGIILSLSGSVLNRSVISFYKQKLYIVVGKIMYYTHFCKVSRFGAMLNKVHLSVYCYWYVLFLMQPRQAKYVGRNIEAHWCTHSCNRKAISVTDS
jgi:hypothetical protein